jgi:ribonuclease Z
MPSQWAGSRPVEFTTPAGDSAVTVYEHDGVVVRAFTVDHAPVEPAVGYRIEYAGRAVVISGDTVRTTSLLEHSRGADLLVAEVMNMAAIEAMESALRDLGEKDLATIALDIRDYHMDVSDVGALAEEAGVARLALTHLAPRPPGRLAARALYRDPVAKVYSGELIVGEDGLRIVIPVDA